MAVFDPTTSAALSSYFPENQDAAKFLNLIHIWWTISNSKYNTNNRTENAASINDRKPLFLRKLADWFGSRKSGQTANSYKFTLSKQITDALIVTLQCTASMIEDLLRDNFIYVLTARLQTDPLELRFSKYRQMSGGRFLVGLREVSTSECILATNCLLKANVSVWSEDIRPNKNDSAAMQQLDAQIKAVSEELENCSLDANANEVSAVVSVYIAKKLLKGSFCINRQSLLTACAWEPHVQDFDFFKKLSRCGLILPTANLAQYVAKAFAIMDTAVDIIRNSTISEGHAGEHILTWNDYPTSFLCDQHISNLKFVHRIICNVYFNNAQNMSMDAVCRDIVMHFKHKRLRKT